MKKKIDNSKELEKFSTEEILNELLRRDRNNDQYFYLSSESVTSYTFKFWKFN